MELKFTFYSVRIAVDRDTSGTFRRLVGEHAPDLPSVYTAAVSLLKVVDESTRAKDGGEFLHVDGTHLPW